MTVEPRSLATRWRGRNPRVIAGQRSPGNVVLHSHAINLLVYHCFKLSLCTLSGLVSIILLQRTITEGLDWQLGSW